MVYKHAISTVVPARNPRANTTAGTGAQAQGAGQVGGYQGNGFERGSNPAAGGFEERGFASSRSGFNRGGFSQERGFERGNFGQGQDRGFERGGFGQDRGFDTPSDNTGFEDTSNDRSDDDNN